MFLFKVISALVMSNIICIADGQLIDSCQTQTGSLGVCMSIYECDTLLTLVKNKDRTPQDVDLLKKSICKFAGDNAVCCPEPCYTPDGQPGLCRNISSCPHLADMLKPPSSKEKMAYVHNSKCLEKDQNSVCCGPPRASPPPVQPGNCKDTVSAFPPDPRSECCGVSAENSKNGRKTSAFYEYPWLVRIEYENTKSSEQPTQDICGGVLISGLYALTNGQCVNQESYYISDWKPKNVRLGEFYTRNEGPDCESSNSTAEVKRVCTEATVVIPIVRVIEYPDYNYYVYIGQIKNDITLLRLKEKAPFTDFIRPICLPNTDITLAPPDNLRLFVSGWGGAYASDVKFKQNLPWISLKECKNAYKVETENEKLDLWEKQVCTGAEGDSDVCTPDAGGPLMHMNDGKYEVIGIFSFSADCGDKPTVYTKLYEYLTWIRNNITP